MEKENKGKKIKLWSVDPAISLPSSPFLHSGDRDPAAMPPTCSPAHAHDAGPPPTAARGQGCRTTPFSSLTRSPSHLLPLSFSVWARWRHGRDAELACHRCYRLSEADRSPPMGPPRRPAPPCRRNWRVPAAIGTAVHFLPRLVENRRSPPCTLASDSGHLHPLQANTCIEGEHTSLPGIFAVLFPL